MQDEIGKNISNHSAMFVPVVAGSDKTTVSVATGHQEYHPVYMLPGNLTNIARHSQGSAVIPVTFLPIPKGKNDSDSLLHCSCFAYSIQEAPENSCIPDFLLPDVPCLLSACV
jgi:hypothetical protein